MTKEEREAMILEATRVENTIKLINQGLFIGQNSMAAAGALDWLHEKHRELSEKINIEQDRINTLINGPKLSMGKKKGKAA